MAIILDKRSTSICYSNGPEMWMSTYENKQISGG